MARYKTILAYDGTCFLGSQRQTHSRTVQGELEKALGMLGWEMSTIHLAGRTDTGTHARGQVASFDLRWDHSVSELGKALNANLPADMAILNICKVESTFRPRQDASSRWYRYRLYCASVRDPMRERYAWRVWPVVSDLGPLAGIWTGTHDFAAFGSPMHKEGRTVRTVQSATWKKQKDEWTFDIRADAFLYRMVRRLVFVQVAASQGKTSPEMLVGALEKGVVMTRETTEELKQMLPAGLAPAKGLTLMEVRYDVLR
jgi:tRNA pseudouridine38-40 synthase